MEGRTWCDYSGNYFWMLGSSTVVVLQELSRRVGGGQDTGFDLCTLKVALGG